MDISIIQLAVYICIVVGALVKLYSKGQQLGNYNFFNKAHLIALIIAIGAVLYIASQTMTSITLPSAITGLTMAFLVTALLAGWAAGDLAYNTALAVLADLEPAQAPATDTTPQSATPTAQPPAAGPPA